MPYIDQSRREEALTNPQTAGELNYAITVLIRDYWKARGNYQAINDIVGALVSAKDEFNRRVTAKYEDSKISANGDVYE